MNEIEASTANAVSVNGDCIARSQPSFKPRNEFAEKTVCADVASLMGGTPLVCGNGGKSVPNIEQGELGEKKC